jgi:hypothetical protein
MVFVGVCGLPVFGYEVLVLVLATGGELLQSISVDALDALADRALS